MKEMFETAILLASAIITIISKTLESAVCSVITCGQVVIVATPAPWATPTSNGPSSPTTTAAASPIGPGELLVIYELLKITVVAGFFAGILFMGNRIITAALPSPPSPLSPLPLELLVPLPLSPPPSPRLELLLPLPPSPPLSPVLSLVVFPAVAFSPLLLALPSPPTSPVSSSNSNNNNSNSTAAATTFAFPLDTTTTTTTNIPEAVTSTAVEPPITGEAALVTVSEEKKKKPRHRAGKKRGASAKEKYARDMFEQLPTLGLEEDRGVEETEDEGQAEGQEEE